MALSLLPSRQLFTLVEAGDFSSLTEVASNDSSGIHALLPTLARLSLECAPTSPLIHVIAGAVETVNCEWALNDALSLLSDPDFDLLERELRTELKLLNKNSGSCVNKSSNGKGGMAAKLNTSELGIVHAFEDASSHGRLRIMGSELLRLLQFEKWWSKGSDQNKEPHGDHSDTKLNAYSESSEEFESDLFTAVALIDDITGILCALMWHIPTIFPVTSVVRGLIHVRRAESLLVRIFLNRPANLRTCIDALIDSIQYGRTGNASSGAAHNLKVQRALLLTVSMGPHHSAYVLGGLLNRGDEALAHVAVHLALGGTTDGDLSSRSDILDGLLGLLTNPERSAWCASFIRSASMKLKKSIDIDNDGDIAMAPGPMEELRSMDLDPDLSIKSDNTSGRILSTYLDMKPCNVLAELRKTLRHLVTNSLSDDTTISLLSISLLRVYCGLIGLAGFEPNEEEIVLCSRLAMLPSHENDDTALRIQFTKVALSFSLVCPNVVSTCGQDVFISWIRRLMASDPFLRRDVSGVDPVEKEVSVSARDNMTSYTETLLLIAIHFHARNLTAVADLVRTSLGMATQVSSDSLRSVSELFTQSLFTEAVLTRTATAIPVTRSLDAVRHADRFLPAQSVLQLLRSGAFARHGVAVKPWVLLQLREAREPLHHILPALIDALVEAAVTSALPTTPSLQSTEKANETAADVVKTSNVNGKTAAEVSTISDISNASQTTSLSAQRLHRLTEVEIFAEFDVSANVSTATTEIGGHALAAVAAAFDNGGSSGGHLSASSQTLLMAPPSAHHILILYYILAINDRTLSARREASRLPSHRAAAAMEAVGVPYPPQLLGGLPVRKLFNHARRGSHRSYECIFPTLMSYVAEQLPQLLDVPSLLWEENELSHLSCSSAPTSRSLEALSTDGVSAVFSRVAFGDTLPALEVLRRFCNYGVAADALIPFMIPLLDILLPLLVIGGNGISRRLIHSFSVAWRRLNSVVPHRLWVHTVNALHESERGDLTTSFTHLELVSSPLAVLRCDARVLRQPLLFSLVLVVLRGYAAASRAELRSRCTAGETGPASAKTLNELRSALVLAQESALIQILLEICQETPGDVAMKRSAEGSSGSLLEVRALIFDALHQWFIREPLLMKLVHVQGYSFDILPVVCEGIPSMHMCLTYIRELVQLPEPSQRAFAMRLTGSLVNIYPLPSALDACRACLSVLEDALTGITMASRSNAEMRWFFASSLPALVEFCKAFPVIADEVVGFMTRLQPVIEVAVRVKTGGVELGVEVGAASLHPKSSMRHDGAITSSRLNEGNSNTLGCRDDTPVSDNELAALIQDTFLSISRIIVRI